MHYLPHENDVMLVTPIAIIYHFARCNHLSTVHPILIHTTPSCFPLQSMLPKTNKKYCHNHTSPFLCYVIPPSLSYFNNFPYSNHLILP